MTLAWLTKMLETLSLHNNFGVGRGLV